MGVSRQTLYNYLEFFEQTYLIHLIPAYSNSADVSNRKVNKLYFFDSGILNRVGKISSGQIFENTIFNQLNTGGYLKNPGQSIFPRISYFQKKSGAEIDFITHNIAYEVKLSGSKNDVSRLERFSKGLKLSNCFVVSLEENLNKNEKIISPFEI